MFEEFDHADFRNGQEFIEYQAVIEAIVHTLPRTEDNGPGEISIRSLHERLDHRARPEWTLDALDGLKSVESIGVLITKFRAIDGQRPKFRKRWNGDGMRWIFAGASAQHREAEFASSAR